MIPYVIINKLFILNSHSNFINLMIQAFIFMIVWLAGLIITKEIHQLRNILKFY